MEMRPALMLMLILMPICRYLDVRSTPVDWQAVPESAMSGVEALWVGRELTLAEPGATKPVAASSDNSDFEPDSDADSDADSGSEDSSMVSCEVRLHFDLVPAEPVTLFTEQQIGFLRRACHACTSRVPEP